MRPIRLEIEGLRSFRTRQVINFTGRDYIAVIGDTGAGKSSILEALTFALYGRTTFSGQGHQELMNASSTALRVVFAFDVGGEHWEVTRTLRRAGTGKVSTGATSLRRFDDEGGPIEAFEKARDVTAKVESILGLDDEAFLRTVVLPQGQFSRLLVDDDQKQRANVLRQIWRTDELTDAGTLASDALTELAPLLGRVAQALEGEPDDAAAHLADLEAEVDRCSALLDAARERQREASGAAKAMADAASQVARGDQLVSLLSKWDGPATVTATREIEAADRRSSDDLADAQQLLDAARVALEAVPADDDGHTLTEIATFAALFESLPGLAARREEAEADVACAQRELDALEERLAGANEAAATASEQLEALEVGRVDLAASAAVAEAKLGPAQAAVKEARRAAAATVDAELRLQAAEAAVTDRAKELEVAQAAQAQASSAHAAAATTFEEARRAAAAAAAGHGLHGGDPCPVCNRELPAEWEPLSAPELETAREALGEASRRVEAATKAVTQKEGVAQSAEEAVAAARHGLASAGEVAAAAIEALVDRLGTASDLDRTDDELLADLVGAITATTGARDAYDRRVTEARATHAALGKEHAAVEATHQAKVTELGGAVERRELAASTFSQQLERVPETLRPTGDDLAAGVARSVAVLQERSGVLDEREAERAGRRREIDELVLQCQKLDETRRMQVDTPVDRLWNAVVPHRSVLDRANDDLAVSVSVPSIEIRPAISELAALVQLVTNATDQLIVAAHASVRGAQASSEAAVLVLSRLAAELALDVDDADRVLARTAALTEDAALDQRRARADAEGFTRRMPAIATLRTAGDALDACYRALSDLAAALRDGAFPKWLTLRRSRSLLVHASRQLSEITAGRYAFADLDDEDSQWFVFDSDNGQPRSPSSLSGGEKFVASLALALGMVEMMGRQGDRIESLFLDEGFGALDRTNLDAAVEALGSVAATGRLVAVITHLRVVAEQIDDVLSVTREPTGTRTVWLDRHGRSELAEADAARGAGLLE